MVVGVAVLFCSVILEGGICPKVNDDNYVMFWLEIGLFWRTTQLGRKGAPGRVEPDYHLPTGTV